jgi:hypothetical protein
MDIVRRMLKKGNFAYTDTCTRVYNYLYVRTEKNVFSGTKEIQREKLSDVSEYWKKAEFREIYDIYTILSL